MKEIPLAICRVDRRTSSPEGLVALIDDEDFDTVSRYKWFPQKNEMNGYYAKTNIKREDGTRTTLYMHRLIAAITSLPAVDHKNSNGLDNQRSNLRPCTHSQNGANSKGIPGSSRFRGVSWHRRRAKWAVHAGRNGHVGFFVSELDAARAYNEAAKRKWGEFARLNNLEEIEV